MSETGEEIVLEVVIVGAGPIGIACGIEAQVRGRSSLILEKGPILNSLVRFPLSMTFFSTSDRLEIGGVPFVSHGPKPTRAEALEYYRRVAEHWRLQVRTYERVTAVSGAKGAFTVVSDRQSYRCRAVILAIGFYDNPNMMGVPGEDLPKVRHYYREPYPFVGRKVLVIGGGNSAVEAALEIHRHGGEVALAVREDGLASSVKYWLRPDLENRVAEGSIRAYFNTTVLEIDEREVLLKTPLGRQTLENDFVLAMTGYHPDFEFLKNAGLALTDEEQVQPVFDRDTFETTVPGIYLAGVVCCGMKAGQWLIENSRSHAPRIFDHLALTE